MTSAAEFYPISSSTQRLAGVRAVVIEDHALLAQSLQVSMSGEGAEIFTVGPACVEDVLRETLRHRPNVVLLDLDLGPSACDGEALIAPLVTASIRVTLLTGSTDAATLGRCLEAGATGIIEKTSDLDVMVDEVRRVAAGERVLGAQRRHELLLESRRDRLRRGRQLAPFESLTEREKVVLAELMRGLRADEISPLLFVSEATVRSHIRGVLLKLGVRSQLAAVALARKSGWPTPSH